MAFFFFGTLMDRDLLERVLGRRLSADELAPARLAGYRRVQTVAADYPALVPCPGEVVDGVLLRSASRRDETRIRHFEDEEHEARVLPICLDDGRPAAARVFIAAASVGRTDAAWDAAGWVRRHKETYLGRCDEWMRDCPE